MLSRDKREPEITSTFPCFPQRNRPIRAPAVRPAAWLSTPTKWSRLELGRSDTNATTARPACLSRITASRTCGVSGHMIATPSNRCTSSPVRMRAVAFASSAGARIVSTEIRSGPGTCFTSFKAARIVSMNLLLLSGIIKAKRYSFRFAKFAADTSRTYPSFSTAFWTSRTLFSRTRGREFSTRSTVAKLTPASLAISRTVGLAICAPSARNYSNST